MKTRLVNFRRRRRSQGFIAVLVLLTLLATMLILIAANTAALNRLTREVKGMEKRQIQRLDPSAKPQSHPTPEATNQPSSR